jgi:hypothetical protein
MTKILHRKRHRVSPVHKEVWLRHTEEGTAPHALGEPAFANDVIEGVKNIATYLNKSERQVFYLCETKQLPVFKLGNRWHLRKSTHARYIARLEAEALGAVG